MFLCMTLNICLIVKWYAFHFTITYVQVFHSMNVQFLAAIFKNGCHGGHVGYFTGVSFFFKTVSHKKAFWQVWCFSPK